jgi:hypothetical protein
LLHVDEFLKFAKDIAALRQKATDAGMEFDCPPKRRCERTGYQLSDHGPLHTGIKPRLKQALDKFGSMWLRRLRRDDIVLGKGTDILPCWPSHVNPKTSGPNYGTSTPERGLAEHSRFDQH